MAEVAVINFAKVTFVASAKLVCSATGRLPYVEVSIDNALIDRFCYPF